MSPNWRIDYFPLKFTDDSAKGGGGRPLRPSLNPPLQIDVVQKHSVICLPTECLTPAAFLHYTGHDD